ncbi:unnamed protein product [marine sediment metagenome]|uniref:Uncharacterized protein n=1 Tax=marine sediment metagenome TaxID=412755 RepID=X0TM99_9ZZZZ
MEKSVLYNKKTIFIFVLISLVFIITSYTKTFFMGGVGFVGFPFQFYNWEISGFGEGIDQYNLLNLILDLIFYYVLAILVSFGISKFNN